MRRIDKLNGLKSWWNKFCKPQYRIKMKADDLKIECLSEFENTGSVEMRSMYSKTGRTYNFTGK